MQDLAQSIAIVLGAIFFILLLASGVSSGGRKSTQQSIQEAANETANAIPVILIILGICAVLLLSGVVPR